MVKFLSGSKRHAPHSPLYFPQLILEYAKNFLRSIPSLLWLLFSVSFLAVVFFALNVRLLHNVSDTSDNLTRKSYIHREIPSLIFQSENQINQVASIDSSISVSTKPLSHRGHEINCRMHNCFNWSRCDPKVPLKVHIYPASPDDEIEAHGTKHLSAFKISPSYQNILNIIESSVHHEADAEKACIFVPRFDTLDRDPLSPDFVKHLSYHFDPPDEGRNHLIFNLYSGTWPHYNEQDFAGLVTRKAILAKASFSQTHFRPGFDISLPLFSRDHPERDSDIDDQDDVDLGENGDDGGRTRFSKRDDDASLSKRALLVFKGKRYIHGIGSETRNSLYHLHNGKDVLIYTTCKHGKKWRKWQQEAQDTRCDTDNEMYDQINYMKLMKNSTFCLVPRGRRLGSFRFLESLQVGCIPVILSDHWVKPFHESIDWNKIVVDGGEKHLLLLPEKLHQFDTEKVAKMREKSKLVYNKYFRSIERIVLTTFNIITERIRLHYSSSNRLD